MVFKPLCHQHGPTGAVTVGPGPSIEVPSEAQWVWPRVRATPTPPWLQGTPIHMVQVAAECWDQTCYSRHTRLTSDEMGDGVHHSTTWLWLTDFSLSALALKYRCSSSPGGLQLFRAHCGGKVGCLSFLWTMQAVVAADSCKSL
jgi:hypothetical protein